MSIDELIADGDKLKKNIVKAQIGLEYLEGQDYEEWKANCIIFVEKNFPNLTVTKNLIEASKKQSLRGYDEMMGILKALKNA